MYYILAVLCTADASGPEEVVALREAVFSNCQQRSNATTPEEYNPVETVLRQQDAWEGSDVPDNAAGGQDGASAGT